MSEPKYREILPGIFELFLPLPMRPTIVNTYLVRCNGEWVLVDTGVGSPESLSTWEALLRAIGCPPAEISTIVCTHHHPDHFGASRALKEKTGARLLVHSLEFDRSRTFASRDRPPEAIAFFRANGIPLERLPRVPSQGEFWSQLYAPGEPDGFLEDGQVLEVGKREFRIVWTPGHAPGHCVVHLPRERVLVVGDHLLPKITPHVGWFPNGPPDPLGDFLDSQRKVASLDDVDFVLPAHGPVYTDHRRRAAQIIQHHDYRMREILDVIRKRPKPAYEIASRVFDFTPESPLTVQFPATFETLAHLRHMMRLGQVECEERDGLVLYVAKGAKESTVL
ncbi:MAG: MBL fold metallo-hydrolase [Candidatus Binatia bacterium]|nr:MAG: MBL fold metallo-hydrolase [Candidatus Binatia bacterium]